MFFSKTALISLFALPTLISANGIRCASSIQLPTLGDKVVIDTNTVTGLFSYDMEFKDKACESASIIAQLSSPSLNSLPIGCASTSPSDFSDNSVFTPSTSTTTSPTLYCNLKNSDLVIGEEYTLTINVNDEAIIRRSFIVESSASKVKNAKDVLPETTLTTPATRYGLAPISLRCESSYIQCPISRNKKRGGFNWACLPAEELTSCGGCPNLLSGDQSGLSGEDCTEIEGVDETECRERKCVVNSCDTGYALINGRCIPALSPNYQQKPIQYVSNSRSDKKTHYAGRVISIAGRLMANR